MALTVGLSSLLFAWFTLFGFGSSQVLTVTPPVVEQAPCSDKSDMKEISNEFNTTWKDLSLHVGNLPEKSCYKESEMGGHTVSVSPYIADSMLNPHDFGVSISMENVETDETLPLYCATPKGYDDLRDEVFDMGGYRITIRHTLNYHYNGGPGSNPNPYTPDVTDVISKVFKSIRVGKC